MKIIIDHSIFLTQQYGGISRYIVNLASRLEKKPDVEVVLFAGIHSNQSLRRANLKRVVGIYVPALPRRAQVVLQLLGVSTVLIDLKDFIQICLIRVFNWSFRADIIHSSYYSTFNLKNVKRAVTVYDFIHENHPDYFGTGYSKEVKKKHESISKADLKFFISNYTFDEFKKLFDSTGCCRVIPLGVDVPIQPMIDKEILRSKFKIRRDFILYVGNRDGYKNFAQLAQWFIDVNLGNTFDLICVGSEFSSAEKRSFAGVDSIRNVGLLSEAELDLMYRFSKCLVISSVDEGFGFTGLESLFRYTPVVCPNIPVFREVYGSLAEFYELNSCKSFVKAVNIALESSTISVSVDKKKKFYSWDACANATLAGYEKVLRL